MISAEREDHQTRATMPLAARHATASSSSFATKNAGVAPRRLRVVAARPPADANDDGAKKKKAKTTYEVKVTTPPERSLGTHRFPANTHCGDTIELRNRYFVVDKVAYHYKLERGKYRKDDSRLYVQEATRFLLNKHLDSLLEKSGGAVDGPSVIGAETPTETFTPPAQTGS